MFFINLLSNQLCGSFKKLIQHLKMDFDCDNITKTKIGICDSCICKFLKNKIRIKKAKKSYDKIGFVVLAVNIRR